MNEAELFGQLLRATRKDRKVNLGKLAEKVDIGVKHLGRIERGEKVPSFELIIALARELNASPATFFHFENANVDSKFLTQQLQALSENVTPSSCESLSSPTSDTRTLGPTTESVSVSPVIHVLSSCPRILRLLAAGEKIRG